MPSFHEVLFPEEISYGSSGGPGFNTTVLELSSGAEQRNMNWSEARASYEASHGIKTREQMEELMDFFYARRGKAFGFRYKDWADYELEQEVIGVSDGTLNYRTFQITKRYEPGTSYYYDRPIRKPVPDTLRVWVGNTPDVQANGNPNFTWECDYTTGLITVNRVIGVGETVRISGEFHVPVRFDTDEMKISQDDYETMSWPSIPLMELRKFN